MEKCTSWCPIGSIIRFMVPKINDISALDMNLKKNIDDTITGLVETIRARKTQDAINELSPIN